MTEFSALQLVGSTVGRVRRTLGLNTVDGDPVLDRLARLAARLLGTPVALVSLLEEEQQVFAGQVGIPADHPYARSTPLSHALLFDRGCGCGGPVTTRRRAPLDARFASNSAIEDLGVIAYAAWPLLTAERRRARAPVRDRLPSRASGPTDDLRGRCTTSPTRPSPRRGPRRAAASPSTRSSARRTSPTTLQHSLGCRRRCRSRPACGLAGRYRPAENLIGGDWYDAFRLPGERIGIAIGDVVGHGIEAAATAGRLRNALRGAVLEHDDPGQAPRAAERPRPRRAARRLQLGGVRHPRRARAALVVGARRAPRHVPARRRHPHLPGPGGSAARRRRTETAVRHGHAHARPRHGRSSCTPTA